MSHWLPRAGVATLAAVLLAACGSGSGGKSVDKNASQSFADHGPITLATGKDTSGTLNKALNLWNSRHPKEKVRAIQLSDSADEQRQRMIQNAQLKSSDFTVLNMDIVWTAEFAANRWIVPLPQDKVDTSTMLRPTVDGATYRGHLYAMPWTSDGGMLYYRKDLLTKVGAQPPTTWAQMRAVCKKVLALPQAKGMSCYAGQFEKYEGLTVNFSEMVDSAGGSVVDENGKPTVNTPQAAQGLQFFVDGFKNGMIPKEAITYQEEQGRAAFQAGKLVFHRQWPYQWSLAEKTDGSSKVAGRFAAAPLPGLNGPGVSSLGGHNLAISAFAKNKGTALDFLKFMTSPEIEKQNLLLGSNAPTVGSLYGDPQLIAKYPYLPVLHKSILTAKPRPRVVRYGDATAAIQEAAYDALTGKTSVKAALASLQQKLTEITQQQ